LRKRSCRQDALRRRRKSGRSLIMSGAVQSSGAAGQSGV
jgi:hypothetical protein